MAVNAEWMFSCDMARKRGRRGFPDGTERLRREGPLGRLSGAETGIDERACRNIPSGTPTAGLVSPVPAGGFFQVQAGSWQRLHEAGRRPSGIPIVSPTLSDPVMNVVSDHLIPK